MIKIFHSFIFGCLIMNCSLIAMEEKEQTQKFFSQQSSTAYSSGDSAKGYEKQLDEKKIQNLNTIFETYSLGLGQRLEEFLRKNPSYKEPLQAMARDYFYKKIDNPKIKEIFSAEVFPFCGWVQGNITIGSGDCEYLVEILKKHIPQNQRIEYMAYLQALLLERAEKNLSLGRIVNRARREFLEKQN